jgi:uncharacterized protein (TIGR02421 family)
LAPRARKALRDLSDSILRASRPVRVLRALAWDRSVHRRFLAAGASELPRPSYPPLGFDLAEKLRELRGLRLRVRGKNPAEELLRGCLEQLVLTCQLLGARGTRSFYRHSVALFGRARDGHRSLALAREWAASASRTERSTLSAEECRRRIRTIVEPVLGSLCRVKLSSRIAACAAAGPRSIAVRSDARFSPRQARALAHHEGLWHVLTAANGRAQPVLTVLGSGLAFHTESQEGGGVASEVLTGNLASDRLAELGARTLAIDRAERGADYLTVWRGLAARFGDERACLLAERVFRGGVLTGGAPFTKDAVYQRGCGRVLDFLRGAAERGDDALVLAFCTGKLSIDDAPTVRALIEEGLVAPPTFLPAWWRSTGPGRAGRPCSPGWRAAALHATIERVPR